MMFFLLLKLIWANFLHFLAEKLFLGNFNSRFPSKPETQELRLPGPWWRLNRISVWWSYTRQDPSTWQKIQRSNLLKVSFFFGGGRSYCFFHIFSTFWFGVFISTSSFDLVSILCVWRCRLVKILRKKRRFPTFSYDQVVFRCLDPQLQGAL